MFESAAHAGEPTAAPVLSEPVLSEPVLSEPVRMLVHAVALLRAQAPAQLPGAQALAESAVLLAELEKLTALSLSRLADVHVRELHALAGAPSAASWVEGLQVGVDRSSLALARKLQRLPGVAIEVERGGLSLPAAIKVGQALDRVRPFLDRPDGLLDGQPQHLVLSAVIVDGVLGLLGQARGGWSDTDPELLDLRARLTEIATSAPPATGRLEAAFVLLAQRVEPAWLHGALAHLVDALLPLQHEGRVERAHRQRGVRLVRDADGSGWTLTEGKLDLECGELLHAVLTAEQATDSENPADTSAWAQARSAQSDDPAGWVAAHRQQGTDVSVPRSLRQRQHDALKLGLRRLLDSGALGSRDKAAPHIAVTVGLDRLHDEPGAMPASSASGSSVPMTLVRRLLCDSRLTRVVLGAGRRVLEMSHTERTLKAHERVALNLQWGGRCAGAGCTAPPGTPLVPHHATPWHLVHTTSLADSVPFCERTHHDLHEGGRPLRLRNGRLLSASGWVAAVDDDAEPQQRPAA